MKLIDIFNINQGHQITDEEIYKSIGDIPIITGNNEIKGYWDKSIVEPNMLPCLTYPTKGFSGTIAIQNKIFDANNTAVLYFKNNMDKHVKLEYIKYILKGKFLQLMTSKENISYLNREIVENIDIEIPSEPIQQKIIDKYKQLEVYTNKIEELLGQLDKIISNKTLLHEYRNYQAKNQVINTILDYQSGNTGLTEEYIYQGLQDEGDKYKVLSSSTSNNDGLGYIKIKNMEHTTLKTFIDKEGILINRKGKAGYTQVIKPGKYTLNDNVYILFVKKNCKYDINLQWLVSVYRKEFMDYSSNCDNGTWNMTGFFKNVKIDIPCIDEQNMIANKWQEVKKLKDNLEKIQTEIQSLTNKDII